MRNFIIAGAAPNSGNLGVSALCDSLVTGVAEYAPDSHISVLDFGNGVRKGALTLQPGRSHDLVGGNYTKRIYRENNFRNILWQHQAGLPLTPTARAFSDAAVLDVSGGDSFTDMYGAHRYKLITYPKRIARSAGAKLILMPQTIGPFKSGKYRSDAKAHLAYSELVYTRDKYSYEYLKELMGEDFDPSIHRQGVDMAFALVAAPPKPTSNNNACEHVGINVSGLILNNPQIAKEKYGINCDYKAVLLGIIRTILEESDSRITLVPHVIVPIDHFESDERACKEVFAALSKDEQNRVDILPSTYSQREIKGAISRFDWFCGTRMHATIAGLSSGVPTVNIAYSGKSLGVFEAIGQQEAVHDARKLNTDEIVSKTLAHWRKRDSTKVCLLKALEPVRLKAARQITDVIRAVS